jgi:hypothetical protein
MEGIFGCIPPAGPHAEVVLAAVTADERATANNHVVDREWRKNLKFFIWGALLVSFHPETVF